MILAIKLLSGNCEVTKQAFVQLVNKTLKCYAFVAKTCYTLSPLAVNPHVVASNFTTKPRCFSLFSVVFTDPWLPSMPFAMSLTDNFPLLN